MKNFVFILAVLFFSVMICSQPALSSGAMGASPSGTSVQGAAVPGTSLKNNVSENVPTEIRRQNTNFYYPWTYRHQRSRTIRKCTSTIRDCSAINNKRYDRDYYGNNYSNFNNTYYTNNYYY